MSDKQASLELNKIAAAILLSSLIAMLVGLMANILYKPVLEPKDRGYSIEITEDTTSAHLEPEAEINIAALIEKASPERGAKIAKKCISCHSFERGGANKIGPNLFAVRGKPLGHLEGFSYSKALLAHGGNWSDEKLYHFLNKPSKYIRGTKMSFAGLKNPEDIADVIAYLKISQ